MVKIELDLVGGGTNRFITSELHLLEEVLVGVLSHLAALVGIKEDIVDVEGSRNKGLLVSKGGRDGGAVAFGEGGHRPEALTDGADIEVDLDLVVLQGNKREGKTRVLHEPELEGDVEGGLREGIAGSAHLVDGSRGSAGSRDTGESRVSDVGKLGSVTNHLEVSALLLGRHGELVPDVHPVTVLAVNALTTDLNLNLGNELLTDVVQPTSIGGHGLVDLGESHLEVSAESKVTIAGNGAGHATTEIGLTREGLLDRFHREVGMASVRHLPESNLGGSSKEHVLGAVSDELHKSTSHL